MQNKPIEKFKTNQSFVHIKHSITIRQYKYWHLLIKFFSEQFEKNIPPDADGFYYESRAKMSEYIGYELMTKELKADVEALRQEPIIINYLEKDGLPAIHGMGFISEYKVTNTKIGFRLPSFIEKVIKGEDENRKLFLLLNWDIFNSFNGKYEAIIYKLCKDYLGVGRTPYFSIDEYRDYIGLSHSDYSEKKSMLRRCVSEPIKKINDSEICDIKVEVELKKIGNVVVGFNFLVKNKVQAILPFEEFSSCSAFKFAKTFITQKDQIKYLELFKEDEIEASIERANTYIDGLRANGKPIVLGAIYNKAISENWGLQLLEEKKIKEKEDEKTKKKLAYEKKKISDIAKVEENKDKKNEELVNLFNSFSNEIREDIVNNFLEKNKPQRIIYNSLKKTYEEHGLEAINNSSMFKGLLLNEISSYKAKEDTKNLLNKFEILSCADQLIEINTILELNNNHQLQQSFERFGLEAFKHDNSFYNALIQHLSLQEIVSNLDN